MPFSISSRAIILICLFTSFCLPGCMAFSDSSAMRIEVEVYKGPLSLEPEIQLGELYGYLLEAHTGLSRTLELSDVNPRDASRFTTDDISQATIRALRKDNANLLLRLTRSICAFLPDDKGTTLCPKIDGNANAPAPDEEDIDQGVPDENTLQQRNDRARAFRKFRADAGRIEYKDLKMVSKPVLTDITRTATAMQVAAFRYATATTAGQPRNFLVRIALTFFIVATSEYGNQLEARADALLKQLGKYGHDRRELPLSTHLRESEPTDFLHLFEWIDGHIPKWLNYITFNSQPDVPDRIKIVERLYADHFWSKINTVYASGRGKTQMAFIKDETGNWNLKSFDNDPTELLESYANVAKAALKNAAVLATSASTGGGSSAGLVLAKQLRDFAAESEPDKAVSQTASPGTLSLSHLRTRLVDKLDPEQFTADLEKEQKLLEVVNGQNPDAAKTAQTQLATHRQQVIARLEAIINDHSNLVDILTSTVKKN